MTSRTHARYRWVPYRYGIGLEIINLSRSQTANYRVRPSDSVQMVDLDSFLSEWRRELSRGGRVSEQLLGKNTRDSQGLDEENEAVPAEKRAAWHIPSGGPLPLLVLPAGGRTQSNKVSDVPREGEGGGGGPRSLVDRLIADLVSMSILPVYI